MDNDEIKTKYEAKIKEAFRNEDIKLICKLLFNTKLTKKQEEIIYNIGFEKFKRIVLCCMTRYGKSWSVAQAAIIYILKNTKKKVSIIAPNKEQARIIKDYIVEFIMENYLLAELIDLDVKGIAKLKKEVSKTRITFKNGCDLRIFTAGRDGKGLMGFGADLVIDDEECLIKQDIYTSKIKRMLGDNPETSMFVSIGNPWDMDNQFYKNWNSDKFFKIHIDYHTALEDGRITEEFVQEQRDDLSPIEFTVLYEAKFPEESEFGLYNIGKIEFARERDFEVTNGIRIISCDPADKGVDWTVIMVGWKCETDYCIEEIFSEPKSDNMDIVNQIMDLIERDFEKGLEFTEYHVKVDYGMGVGIVSRLQERLATEKKWDNVNVMLCQFGSGAVEKKRFLNAKVENYFRNARLFKDHKIKIPKHEKLKTELMSMKWVKSPASDKFKIEDPKKSPDFADACMLFTWWSGDPDALLDLDVSAAF